MSERNYMVLITIKALVSAKNEEEAELKVFEDLYQQDMKVDVVEA